MTQTTIQTNLATRRRAASIAGFGLLAMAILAPFACLGVLVLQSQLFPRFLGVLVLVAGGGYLVDSLGALLLPAYALTVSEVTFIGEALLIFWLVWFGIKGVDRASRMAAQTET